MYALSLARSEQHCSYLPDLVPLLAKGPVLLLLPMRLGSGPSVTPAYVPMVQTMFLATSFVGIIGNNLYICVCVLTSHRWPPWCLFLLLCGAVG